MQLHDKVALVTGGASGLGRGICLVLAERGADVAVADIDLDGVRRVEAEVAQHGHRVRAFEVDVTDRARMEDLDDAANAIIGRVDIHVNSTCLIV